MSHHVTQTFPGATAPGLAWVTGNDTPKHGTSLRYIPRHITPQHTTGPIPVFPIGDFGMRPHSTQRHSTRRHATPLHNTQQNSTGSMPQSERLRDAAASATTPRHSMSQHCTVQHGTTHHRPHAGTITLRDATASATPHHTAFHSPSTHDTAPTTPKDIDHDRH